MHDFTLIYLKNYTIFQGKSKIKKIERVTKHGKICKPITNKKYKFSVHANQMENFQSNQI
jgi:hypothetical protein